MFKNYYEKYIKKIFASKGVDPLRVEISPFRDWKIIVLGFFAAFVVSLVFNLYMFNQINNDSFFAATAQKNTSATLDRDGLARVLSLLEAKNVALSAPATTTPIVDPSR